ncbi:MAG: hypothetical protein ABIR39_18315 [Nocardioides sp.]
MAWEEKRMALAEAANALVDPDRRPETVTDLLPKPERRRSA